ncbi:MAG: 2-C-methyl-D-erythritol 2,4-cyclodiphosphate synthase [Kosmotoga sp.]|uniref:2-C-methyl-D-erythritol 2,4-cyclodiphosphate synthase n=1 Tax=Kosmotoga sp. TaxID=1955248 RepID=UPI001D743318|nr:2-C-methyl-D-erythritol 2,4-cyclodiphosphate synthase [Kosmotoga sp.]MBO8166500.1 2-C-methyl-D-erythritol 2,4-cyclodiphosphate synthase [Kosmotoga sp.]
MYRTGIGYDIHPLKRGDKGLYIGGVKVSDIYYAKAHSDGDVLVHAILDAVLGASCKGNIGALFPEIAENLNRRSLEFLDYLRSKIIGHGFRIVNIDSVVIVENVRLTPYLEEITKSITEALSIEKSRFSLKPKSGNGMFADSIQAYVTCLLSTEGVRGDNDA